jgi:DNA-directed RNA polymerase subunit K/omega
MIQLPPGLGKFEFVVVATLRAAQLMKGCRPKVETTHKPTVTAQVEVSEGKVWPLSYQNLTLPAPLVLDVVPVG